MRLRQLISEIKEAEEVHILNNHIKFPVYKNPSRKDAIDLHNDIKAKSSFSDREGEIRTLKHGNNLYAWDAEHATHHEVKNDLGISRYDHSEHGYSSTKDLKNNKFDIHKTHKEGCYPPSNLDESVILNEGKVVHIDGGKVFINPNREQAKNIHDDTYRTMHDGKNMHLWGMKTNLIHPDMERHLGLNWNNSTRAFFHHKDLEKNNFDVRKTHQEFRVRADMKNKDSKPSYNNMDAEIYYDNYHPHKVNEIKVNTKMRLRQLIG